MRSILERSRYVVQVAVASLLVAAIAAIGWGVVKTFRFVSAVVSDDDVAIVKLLQTVDVFLLATVLLIMALGLYELFVGELTTPAWLEINDLGALKTKLGDVVVLVLAINFVELLVAGRDAIDLVLIAGGIALVGATLVALTFARDRGH